MLNLQEFRDYVEATLPELLPEDRQDVVIEQHDVKKNNGLTLHAISVRPAESEIAPNIYVDPYFERYKAGEALDTVMKDVTEVVVKNLDAPKEFEKVAKDFQNFDTIKDRIIMAAVNTEKNADLLKEVPHTEKEDLSLIYKAMIGGDDEGMATITIRNEHMAHWGVTTEELHELAMENTRELLPVTVRTMDEVMRGFLGEDVAGAMFEDVPPEGQMYIISNKENVNGAASMFYEDTLSELSEKIGSDLYILPSSIHEVIAVSSKLGTPEELSQMVREVNGSQVAPEEQLSDHVYKFDAETKKLSLADTTMEELKKAAGAEDMAATEGSRPHHRAR
jgi:hypothetical protein